MGFEVRVLRRDGTLRFREEYLSWMDAIDRARSIANDNGYDVRVYSADVLIARWIEGDRSYRYKGLRAVFTGYR
jgi:hypothetical protein